MDCSRIASGALGLVASTWLAACADLPEAMIASPDVSLNRIEVKAVDFDSQTVLLGFDVTNPNPFPLPVESMSYGVKLDGHRFASGEAKSDFTVPAQSDAAIAISVELDLLKTAPKLINVVRQGAHRDIPYALEGRFSVDLPAVRPVTFEETGTIRLLASR
jgi:LEA14-like dessication related protein